jgi:hypothetical protein
MAASSVHNRPAAGTASSSHEHPAAGTANPQTPWRSGFADPPVVTNSQWKNKKHYQVEKIRLPASSSPLSWSEWCNRLSGYIRGQQVESSLKFNADWSQDGNQGRPLGLLCQISKYLAYQLRWNLPTFPSYNKRTGTISLQELFWRRDFKWIRSTPELFYLACIENPKSRFHLEEILSRSGRTEEFLLGAHQGHSEESAPDKETTCTRISKETLNPSTKFVIHGTSYKNAEAIIKDKHIFPGGLDPKLPHERKNVRKDVHWSWAFPQVPGEQITGLRAPSEVYIFLNLPQYLSHSEAWETANNLVLTGSVHIRDVWSILDASTGTDVRASRYNSYDVPDHILIQFHTLRVNTFDPKGEGFRMSKEWMLRWQEHRLQRPHIPSVESLPPLNEERMQNEEETFEVDSDVIEEEEIEELKKTADDELPDWEPEDDSVGAEVPEPAVPSEKIPIAELSADEKMTLMMWKKERLSEDFLQLDFDEWWSDLLTEVENEAKSSTDRVDLPSISERLDQTITIAVESIFDLGSELDNLTEKINTPDPDITPSVARAALNQDDVQPILHNIRKNAVQKLREYIVSGTSVDDTRVRRVVDQWGGVQNPPEAPSSRSAVLVPEHVLERAKKFRKIKEDLQAAGTVPNSEAGREAIDKAWISDLRSQFLNLVSKLPTKGSIYRMGEEQDAINKDQRQFNLLLANFGNIFRHGQIGDFRVENNPDRTGKAGDIQYQGGEFNLLYRVWADNMATVLLTCEANGLDHAEIQKQSEFYGLRGMFTEHVHKTSCHVRAGSRGSVRLLEEFLRQSEDGKKWQMYGGVYEITFGSHSDPKERGRLVSRAGLERLIVAVYHINNDFCNTMANVRQTYQDFLDLAFKHRADVIGGDANKAGLRYYNRQQTQDPWNSTVCVMIRRYVSAFNEGKALHRQIGVQEYNNTQPDDLASLENLDCMWIHLISWGKTPIQKAVRTAIEREGLEAAKNHSQSEIRKGAQTFPHEWKVSIHERAIALDRYELGIGPRDNDSHRPLLLFISEQAMSNKRDRTAFSQYYRSLTYHTKTSAEDIDLRWSQARQAITTQRQIDTEGGWQHPHTNVQYKRGTPPTPSERPDREAARGSTDPPPSTGGTGDHAYPRRARSRSRPRSPERSWNWNSNWWWSSAWSGWTWNARGQNPDDDDSSFISDPISWLTMFLIIAGTMCVLFTLRSLVRKIASMFNMIINRVNGSPQKLDQSVQVGNCSHAMEHVFTTAQGECVHLFPTCSSLRANRTTVIQERTLCSICSSQFDQHYSSIHPEATFCRLCKMWLESDQAYIAHLSSTVHRNNATRVNRR